MRRLLLVVTLAAQTASCSSENVNPAATSGGGAAGTGSTGGTGGTGGAGATGGSTTGGSGGDAGSTGGDAGVDAAPNACALQGDAGDIGKWPDSKTQWCSGPGCIGGGEDGDYVLSPPTYTVSGNVVKDQVTGLEWRKDVIADKLWADAAPACAALNADAGGGDPWRLPTRFELMSLLDFGSATALLQPAELDPPTKASTFWTSTESSANPSVFAWGINFNTGSVGGMAKTGALSSLSVRCVRGTARTPKLELNASCDIVNDVGMGLMWYRPVDGAKYEWPAALKHCQSLSHAGFDDWRLPSAKELMTIVLDTASQPAIDPNAFAGTPTDGYWSSTPRRADPKSSQVVDFGTGAEFAFAATGAHRARCVRSLP